MSLKVKHAMKREPPTICIDTTVTESAGKMIKTEHDTLIILDKDEIVGTINAFVLLRYTYTEGFRPNQTPVSEIANSNIIFARPNTSLNDILSIMIETGQFTLPVVEGSLVGLINIHDILKLQPRVKPLKQSALQA